MKKIAIFIFISLILQYSCKKEEQFIDNDIQSVIDDISADNALQNIFSTVNGYAITYLSERGTKIDSNAIVSITPLYPLDSFPKTMIIDYCNGMQCNDGKVRKGRIITVFNDRWVINSSAASLTAEVTTNNYFENNVQIIGSFSILFNGSTDSLPSFTVNTSDAKLILENGDSSQWSSSNITKWISGFQTIDDISDDVFLFTGTKTGINCKGLGYESNITSPLEYFNSCQNGTITKGKIELIPQDISKRVIDFGNGDCDRKATVKINGVSVEIDF